MPTKPKQSNRRMRSVCFTAFHNEASKMMAILESSEPHELPVRYLCYGNEICPETKRPHEQSFMMLTKRLSFRQVKKLLGEKCRFVPIDGTPAHNIKYCSKDGDFHEWGDPPKQGCRTDLKETVDAIWRGEISVDDIMLDNPKFYHMYGRTLRDNEDKYLTSLRRNWHCQGYWFYGPTGTGKSYTALTKFPDAYVHNLDDKGWWDGYQGEETVLIDDFRPGTLPYNQLLGLMQEHPFTVPRRGRCPYPMLAKRVIITAPMHPEEAFKHLPKTDSILQLLRRLIVCPFTVAYVPPKPKEKVNDFPELPVEKCF